MTVKRQNLPAKGILPGYSFRDANILYAGIKK
jgi:hypothetical protein